MVAHEVMAQSSDDGLDGGALSPDDTFRLDDPSHTSIEEPASYDAASQDRNVFRRANDQLLDPSELPPLDPDELPPLPPAQRAVRSPEGPFAALFPQLVRKPSTSASSLRSSPMLSSFRLDESPRHLPTARCQSPHLAKPWSEASAKGGFEEAGLRETQVNGLPAARYVTVSAILSRSEVYFPTGSQHADILKGTFDEGDRPLASARDRPSLERDRAAPQSYGIRRRGSRKGPSNGSAVEALGALLLHRDSSGKVSSLSLIKDADAAPNPKRTVVQSWAQALNEVGKLRLGLAFPETVASRSRSQGAGSRGTIAERRARKWGSLLLHQADVALGGEGTTSGFKRVRSSRGGLSFDVGISAKDGPMASSPECQRSSPPSRPAQPLERTVPDTILLRADKRPDFANHQASEYGIGSSFHAESLPEAPPSPLGMPGAWHGGSAWRAKPGEGFEEGALLLPPPLLDDQGSDANSFEGLLGVRRMREQAKANKQMERLRARNRPTHKVGTFTALLNFVKAAHAAEASARRAQKTKLGPVGMTRSVSQPAVSQAAFDPAREGMQTQVLNARMMHRSGSASIDAGIAGCNGDASSHPGRSGGMGPSSARYAWEAVDASAVDGAGGEPDFHSQFAGSESFRVASALSPNLQAVRRRHSRRGSVTASFDAVGRQLNTVFETGSFDPVTTSEPNVASPELTHVSSPILRPSSRGSSISGTDLPSAPRLLPIQMSLPPSPFTPLGFDHRSQQRERLSSHGSHTSDYWSARPLPSGHVPQTPRIGPTVLSIPPSPWTPHQGSAPALYQLHLNTSVSSLRQPGTPRLIPTHLEVLPSPFPTPAVSRRGSIGADKVISVPSHGSPFFPTHGKSPLSRAQSDRVIASPALDSVDPLSKLAVHVDPVPATSQQSSAHPTSRDHPGTPEPSVARLTPATLLREPLESGLATPTVAKFEKLPEDPEDPVHDAGAMSTAAGDVQEKEARSEHSRSFLLWFLVGDLGLRSQTSSQATRQVEVGGIAGVVFHTFGFVVFCLAHLVDLIYQVAEHVALAAWFVRWLYMNATGQTVLSRCVLEAYRLIQSEWATVAQEDHEARGAKRRLSSDGKARTRGLTRWQVLRGLCELFCLQSVTRDRYHREGAGLVRLDGWSKRQNHSAACTNDESSSGRLDLGAHKADARATFEQASRVADTWSEDGHGKEDDGDEDDDDSSDDEMIVTNRGHDILEFSKTPRLDPVRFSQPRNPSGYFGTSYEATTSPVLRSSASDAAGELKALRESPRELIKTVKWASRLAISAYGLHVHIVDLPSTFTPSGNRFSRQTFAYLSRLDAEDVLHADIQTLDVEADYSPTFYIVRDYVRKVVCVAVRGTQSFSDIIVDLEMRTEEVELPQVQPSPGEEFRCHAGIWRAAKALVSPDSKLFEKLRIALEENEDFGLIFCGHSLGGAIASAAALLLGEYRVPDGVDREQGSWFTNMSSGLPPHRPIRAISFANPVTMTADLAARAGMGSIPLVTSVILGSDIIPRAGHGQVREIRRVLGALARVRRRHAMSSSGEEDARVHILRSYWDWRSICKASNPDDVMLHRKARIEEQLWSLRRQVESELYAAVKSRLDEGGNAGNAMGAASRVPPSPWVGPEQRAQAPLHQLTARRQALDSATLRSEAAQGGPLIPPGKCLWIEGKDINLVTSPLSFFSLPEFRLDMFAMHFPAAYEEAILNLRA